MKIVTYKCDICGKIETHEGNIYPVRYHGYGEDIMIDACLRCSWEITDAVNKVSRRHGK